MHKLTQIKFIIFCFFPIFCLFSCSEKRTIREIVIQGELKNLPDGNIILLELSRKSISNSKVENGKFIFNIKVDDNFEPRLIAMEHLEPNGTKRLFNFKTNRKYKNESLYINTFFLEDNLIIGGSVEDVYFSKDSALSKIKFVRLTNPIEGGKQTKIFYSDTLNIEEIQSISKLETLIKKAPYSYFFLYNVEKRIPNLSNSQVLNLLKCFDIDLQNGKTGTRIKNYLQNRNRNGLNNLKLLDSNATLKPIFKSKKINLIILWASWCGPCRKEIPKLKKIYSKYINNPNFSMLSVSLDEDIISWKKALDKEAMSWEQLIILPEQRPFQQDIFQFDGSIPTTLFVNKSGKIIHKIRGFDEKEGLTQTETIINYYLDSNK